jgi:hypothetical protein
MPRASYFLGSRFLGASEVPRGSASQAFLCDVCGEVWARIVIPEARWAFEFSRCERHPDASRPRIAGSLLRYPPVLDSAAYLRPESQPLALDYFPDAAVSREFTLHLNQAIKEMSK